MPEAWNVKRMWRSYYRQWTAPTLATLLLVIALLAGAYTVLFTLVHSRDNTDPKEQNENPHTQIQKH